MSASAPRTRPRGTAARRRFAAVAEAHAAPDDRAPDARAVYRLAKFGLLVSVRRDRRDRLAFHIGHDLDQPGRDGDRLIAQGGQLAPVLHLDIATGHAVILATVQQGRL